MAEMMNASAKLEAGMRFNVETGSGHRVTPDASEQDGGQNTGPRPIEQILVGLAGCTGMDVISILRKKRQQVTDYEVRVHGIRASQHPMVFTDISVEHIVTGHQSVFFAGMTCSSVCSLYSFSALICSLSLLTLLWQTDIKCAALAHNTLSPQFTVMQFDDMVTDGQAEATSLSGEPTIDPVKWFKDVREVMRRNALPTIADPDDDHIWRMASKGSNLRRGLGGEEGKRGHIVGRGDWAQQYLDRALCWRVNNGVLQEVIQDLSLAVVIGVNEQFVL